MQRTTRLGDYACTLWFHEIYGDPDGSHRVPAWWRFINSFRGFSSDFGMNFCKFSVHLPTLNDRNFTNTEPFSMFRHALESWGSNSFISGVFCPYAVTPVAITTITWERILPKSICNTPIQRLWGEEGDMIVDGGNEWYHLNLRFIIIILCMV